MSQDPEVGRRFGADITAHQMEDVAMETWLVVVHQNYKLSIHKSSDPSSLTVASSIAKELKVGYLYWKLFTSHDELEAFHARLLQINQIKNAYKSDPMESLPSEAANATTASLNSSSTDNPNASPGTSTTTRAPTFESTTHTEGTQKVEATGAFDMSNMKFSFDNKGASTEVACGIVVTCSHAFRHRTQPYSVAANHLRQIKSKLWHLDARFFNWQHDQYAVANIDSRGLERPMFMTTMRDIAVCDRSNPHEYKRVKGGQYTRNVTEWCVKVPNGFQLADVATNAVQTLCSPFKSSSKDCGMIYANWLAKNKSGAYNSETGVTSKKKKITHQEFAKQMQVKLVNGFSKFTIEWNTPLDQFMTWWDIKQFLTEKLGYTHISEVPVTEMKFIIGRYPAVQFPEWNTIIRPEY